MWEAEDGTCLLTGMRAAVFADAADRLLSALATTRGEYATAVASFDDLTYGQKVSCLDTIVRGLLAEDLPVVEPTLSLAAAVEAVYGELRSLITTEIDHPEVGTALRERVVAAVAETAAERGYDPAWIPDPASADERMWFERIGRLQAEVVEDAGEDAAESVADLPGNYAREIRQILGISDEYLLTVPDDLKDEQVEHKTTELHVLIRSVVDEVI